VKLSIEPERKRSPKLVRIGRGSPKPTRRPRLRSSPSLLAGEVCCRAARTGLAYSGFLLALLAVSACRKEAPPAPDVIARIEQVAVRYPEFERYLRENGAAGEIAAQVLPALFDRFLDERLLARSAAERGLVAVGTPVREAVDALLAGSPAAEPTAAEIDQYHATHESEFSRPERVRLRQIFTTDAAAAERAAIDIAAGGSFAAVARGMSRDPSAERGGEEVELSREDLPPAIAEVVFRLQPGQTSELVRAEYGFHLFQVVERLPATTLSAAQAAPEIRAALLRERGDQQLAALVASVRSQYNVEIYAYNLPFPYQGPYADAARAADRAEAERVGTPPG
jgi:PPIC-type PPIASE domain